MSTIAFNISDLVAKYRTAKNKDEEAIAIIDIVRNTQEEVKQEIVKELHAQDFASKADLFATKAELKADIAELKADMVELKAEFKEEIHAVKLSIEKAKFSAVAWILTGIWLPLILAGGVWFLKH